MRNDIDGENSTWTIKQGAHDVLIKKYNDEIDIINQAIQVLKEGGVVRGD